MKKFAITLLAAAVAVPMMFAADAPQTGPASPATTMAKKQRKSKKPKAALVTPNALTGK